MSLYTILGVFFVGTTVAYPQPSGSGPGITVQQAHRLQNSGGSSFTCTTSEGVPYYAGSTIINTMIHQMATCTGPNYWGLSTYPSDCNIRDKEFCWNNCAHNFSGTCSYYCECMQRLGSGGDPFNSDGGSPRLGAAPSANDDDEPRLGHSAGGRCPWWLPQAIDQLTPGFDGFSCYYPGQYCHYPSDGMDFYCQNGIWNLVGHGPAPSPSPAPAPSQCPHWNHIFNGDWCPSDGVLCEYPLYFVNFMCTNGRWVKQGSPNPPVPSPTPAPANPVNCPIAAYPPSYNGFCAVPNLTCRYPSGAFVCYNGRWKQLQY